jgi:hypothetical protein
MSVSMKIEFNGEIRRHQLERVSFADLQASVASMFAVAAPFSLKYTDEDNDAISLTSDAELREAISIAQRCGKMLRITVARRTVPAPAAPAAQAAVGVPVVSGGLKVWRTFRVDSLTVCVCFVFVST